SPTYGDHEDSPGQLELNFLFDRAVRTADSLSTYRQICAAVARKHGVIATFMPKPFTGVSANGAHHHFTLVDEDGRNVFYDEDGPAKLSELGLQFMGGILDHYRGLCGVTASTVNSYKRFWDFGFWAPIYKDYGWQNRTTLVRVASGGRFEFRAVDSSCNPYLTQAALLKAGLDGVKRKLDPGPPQQRNVYDVLDEGAEIPRVPGHLGEALEALEQDEVVRSALPGRLYDVFMHYKRDFEFADRIARNKYVVEQRLRKHGARIHDIEEETDYAYRVVFAYEGDLKALTDLVEDVPGAEVLSLGHSLEIVKDLGDAEAV